MTGFQARIPRPCVPVQTRSAATIRAAGYSAHELDAPERAGVGDDVGRRGAEPLLDEARVDPPEVDRDPEVVLAVQRGGARIRAQHPRVGGRAQEHPRPARARGRRPAPAGPPPAWPTARRRTWPRGPGRAGSWR